MKTVSDSSYNPLFSFAFQFDFVISLRDLKEILDTIVTYIQIPDYYPEGILDPLVRIHSVKVIVFEEGPRLSWQAIAQKNRHYSRLLHTLLYPTWFFILFRELKIEISYNEIFNHFFTPLYPVTRVEASGFLYFDSAHDYYTYHTCKINTRFFFPIKYFITTIIVTMVFLLSSSCLSNCSTSFFDSKTTCRPALPPPSSGVSSPICPTENSSCTTVS